MGGRGDTTRAVLLCRVSRKEQVEGYSLDAQRRAYHKQVAERGWEDVGEYAEEGRSAQTDNPAKRPRFRELLADAARGQFDLVVVHKLDRFSRNLRVTLESFDQLGRANVGLLSILEPQIDYTTPQGKLFFHMLGVLAQFYSDNLSQETRKGKAERKAQGLYNGLLPFGLTKASDGKDALPVPDERPLPTGSTNWAGYLLAMHSAADGMTDAEVAALLNEQGYRTTGNRGQNLWRKDSVRRLLTNRIFLGELPDGKGGWVPGKHPAYVEASLWDGVQRARQVHRSATANHTTSQSRVYSLTGLLRCGPCEESGDPRRGAIHISMQHAAEPRANCYARTQGIDCPQRSAFLRVYEEQVAEWLKGLEIPDDAVDLALAELRREARGTPSVEDECKRLETRLARLKELYQWGDLGRAEYQAQRDELRVKLQALAPEGEQRRSLEPLADALRSAYSTWEVSPPEVRNKLLRGLLQKIVVNDTRVVAIIPRPELAALLPSDRGGTDSALRGGSDGDCSSIPMLSRYRASRSLLPESLLAALAAAASEVGIRPTASLYGVSRATVRRALALHQQASPWAACTPGQQADQGESRQPSAPRADADGRAI